MLDRLRPAQESVDGWLAEREVIRRRRPELSRAAGLLYPQACWIEATGFLARPAWLPAAPLPLEDVALRWEPDAAPPSLDGLGAQSEHIRPPARGGGRYPTYAAAIADLDPPALFENRAVYRLLAADLAGGAPSLAFGRSRFFDAVNVNHAVAHELAAVWAVHGAASMAELPLREAVGDPCALRRRPALTAVITLTLRRSPGGQARLLLHWRDPAKVAHAGGVYQVLPAGIFQPAAETGAAQRHDLSLWQAMTREFSEELLGTAEIIAAGDGLLDYQSWPFYQRLTSARGRGDLDVWCLGAGVDPLTLATDILTVAVFDGPFFDDVFAGLVESNEEGRVVWQDGLPGIPFTRENVARLSAEGAPTQPAGAALLRLAWRHRAQLLGGQT